VAVWCRPAEACVGWPDPPEFVVDPGEVGVDVTPPPKPESAEVGISNGGCMDCADAGEVFIDLVGVGDDRTPASTT
jgi:hypothetical protein